MPAGRETLKGVAQQIAELPQPGTGCGGGLWSERSMWKLQLRRPLKWRLRLKAVLTASTGVDWVWARIEAASASGETLEKQDWSFDPTPGRIAAPC